MSDFWDAESMRHWSDRRGRPDRLASIESRLGLLTWMVGFNIAFTVGVLWKLFA